MRPAWLVAVTYPSYVRLVWRWFWLAVARFATRRVGDHVLRPYREPPTDEEWAAYADDAKAWADASLPLAAETWPPYHEVHAPHVVVPNTTTTAGNVNITWKYT